MTMMHIIRVVGVTFRSKHSPSRFTTFSNNLNVFTKVNNSGVVCGSVIVKWRGKSYSAASASASELPKPKPKPPKRRRVPRDVRRAMVESYVNKYRATHAGKFPTVYDVTKEVGGSHYVNRSIFQELVYNSKISTSNKKSENLLGEELLKENESFIEVEKVPTKEMNMDAGIHGDYKVVVNNVEIGDTSNKHLKEERRKKASPGVEKMLSEEVGQPTIPGSSSDFVAAQSDLLERDVEDLSYPSLEISKGGELKVAHGHHSDFVAAENHLLKDIEEISHRSPEKPDDEIKKKSQEFHSVFSETETHRRKGETEKADHPFFKDAEAEKEEQTASEISLDSNAPEHKNEQYEGSHEKEKHGTSISSEQTDDKEPPKKSTVWENLKAFADGIIGIWRRN